jgi:hypothetical protein
LDILKRYKNEQEIEIILSEYDLVQTVIETLEPLGEKAPFLNGTIVSLPPVDMT